MLFIGFGMAGILQDELRRVVSGPEEGANDNCAELMEVHVSCPGNALAVHRRIREVYTVLLSAQIVCEANPDASDEALESFYKMYGGWYAAYAKESGTDPESFEIDDVKYFDEERDWFWWDARVLDKNNLIVYINVVGFPISGFELLRNLLINCGATDVVEGGDV